MRFKAMPRGFIVYLLMFSGCMNCLHMKGQVHRFQNYTTENGLLSDEVYSIHEDKKGYIWFFTLFGVQKYNGTEFRQVLKNLPLDESFMYSVYEHKNGRMWVANSKANIYEIKNDSAFLLKGIEPLSALLRKNIAEIYQIHVDDSMNIYLITKLFAYKLVRNGSEFKFIDLRTMISDSTVHYKIFQKNESVFPVFNFPNEWPERFLRKKDSLKLEIQLAGKDRIIKLRNNYSTGPRAFKKYHGDFYFSFRKLLVKISPSGKINSVPFNSIILNFELDRNGHAWLACLNDGLYEVGVNDSIIGHYLENSPVNDIMPDTHGGLWASTAGLGIFHCADLNTQHFKETTLQGKPMAFIKSIDNNLILASTKGDIVSLEKDRLNVLQENNYETEPTDVIKMNNNYVFAYRDKVEVLFPNGKIEQLKNDGVNASARSLYAFGDTLVIMMRKNFLHYVNNKMIKNSAFDFKLFCCYKWKGALLLATENGLFLFKDGMLTQPAFLFPAKGCPVQKIVQDRQQRLWLCTQGYGVFILDASNKLIQLNTSNGLPVNFIYNVKFTDDQRILLSTSKGLFVSPYNSAPDQLKWENIYPDAVHDAIPFDNKLYLRSRGHLVIIAHEPAQTGNNYHFNFARMFVNSKQINISKLPSLQHNENNLEFDFDLISFTKIPVKLSYSLSGPLNESGTTIIHDLKFNNLLPGDYTLAVTPQVKNGDKIKMTIPFTIIAAYYQTAAFKILIFFLLALLIFFITWLIFKTRKKRQDLKTKAENLILEYKLIALKAQINPHFMSNCLSSIQNLILNNHIIQATNYISMFGLLVRQILNFSTRSLITIHEELEIANLYLELEQMRFKNKFSFKIEIDEKVDPKLYFVPALILNPIIENAVWHGISTLDEVEKGSVFIKINQVNKNIVIMISDNGSGYRNQTSSVGNTRASKGVELVKQRLQNINFLYGIDSARIIYESPVDSKNKNQGTTALIVIPNNIKPLNNE